MYGTLSERTTIRMSEVTMTKQPKNIAKDKRSWWLSHEAFLYFQALAEQQGLNIPQFFEVLSRDLAQQRLSNEQRANIKDEADRISAKRKNAASHAQD